MHVHMHLYMINIQSRQGWMVPFGYMRHAGVSQRRIGGLEKGWQALQKSK